MKAAPRWAWRCWSGAEQALFGAAAKVKRRLEYVAAKMRDAERTAKGSELAGLLRMFWNDAKSKE